MSRMSVNGKSARSGEDRFLNGGPLPVTIFGALFAQNVFVTEMLTQKRSGSDPWSSCAKNADRRRPVGLEDSAKGAEGSRSGQGLEISSWWFPVPSSFKMYTAWAINQPPRNQEAMKTRDNAAGSWVTNNKFRSRQLSISEVYNLGPHGSDALPRQKH